MVSLYTKSTLFSFKGKMRETMSIFETNILKCPFDLERVNGGEMARTHRLARILSSISDICCRFFFFIFFKNVWMRIGLYKMWKLMESQKRAKPFFCGLKEFLLWKILIEKMFVEKVKHFCGRVDRLTVLDWGLGLP